MSKSNYYSSRFALRHIPAKGKAFTKGIRRKRIKGHTRAYMSNLIHAFEHRTNWSRYYRAAVFMVTISPPTRGPEKGHELFLEDDMTIAARYEQTFRERACVMANPSSFSPKNALIAICFAFAIKLKATSSERGSYLSWMIIETD